MSSPAGLKIRGIVPELQLRYRTGIQPTFQALRIASASPLRNQRSVVGFFFTASAGSSNGRLR
jgi:hypothetical protein